MAFYTKFNLNLNSFMKKLKIVIFLLHLIFVSSDLIGADIDPEWKSKLYLPTYIGKHADNFIIVNCWQHRIIYSEKIDEDIENWEILDDEIAGPHSFSTNGDFLIAEGTGRDALILYKLEKGSYVRIQRLEGITRRPHRVHWRPETNSIWVLTSNNQKLYKIAFNKYDDLPLSVESIYELPFLNQTYTRSFSIIDGKFYFVSGPSHIQEVEITKEDVMVTNSYKIPTVLGGDGKMADVFRSSDGWWYFSSVGTRALIRSKSLNDLSKGNFEILNKQLGLIGTPYYISEFDDRIWLTSMNQENGIISFQNNDQDLIVDITHHFNFGPKTKSDSQRAIQLPR